jgi:D-serine dehydratase
VASGGDVNVHDDARSSRLALNIEKGLPLYEQLSIELVRSKAWNVLREDLPFPLLLLKDSALSHNIAAMSKWCAANGFLLAPHGKATMCPRIFERQLQAGAWALTVSTVAQAAVCAQFGIRRIFIANQLIGAANIRSLAALMENNPASEVFCLVDSVAGIRLLSREWKRIGVDRVIHVLLEYGRKNWRTGVRSIVQAIEVYEEIIDNPDTLVFRGIEGFEGSAHHASSVAEGEQVNSFLSDITNLARKVRDRHPQDAQPLLLSVGGSAFLDRVREYGRSMRDAYEIVLRSGCYVTHDHGYYARKHRAARERTDGPETVPHLQPALELWSYVQSIPEKHLAILNFGKRDCAYDIDLPIPLYACHAGQAAQPISLVSARISRCNDQHSFLKYDEGCGLSVGDQVCCGISHPCTAFDKWRLIPLVDDEYNVIDLYQTFF